MPSHLGVCTFDHHGHLIYASSTFDKVIPVDKRCPGPIWNAAENPRQLRAEFAECLLTDESVTTETPVATNGQRIRLVHSYYALPEGREHRVACVFSEPMRGERLAPREIECLRLLADGMQMDEIAAKLDISDSTVKSELYRARAKLGARNGTHAVALAARHGLL